MDKHNYIYVDGAKVCRYIPERKVLEFVDHNRQRREGRGTRFVEVGIYDLVKALASNKKSD
jgi:hypothetical protein